MAGVACEELPHRPGSGQRAGDPAAPGQQQYAREEVIRRTIPDRRLSLDPARWGAATQYRPSAGALRDPPLLVAPVQYPLIEPGLCGFREFL